ncbi:hypothetical protein PR003_g13153 [Phytophthora rubi]|uniref:Reverse transcriptase domain-containing protein n=1 Tax=Phytophthora rubi TaxID=129364 RepID=A0A6A4FG43_9STRA|nr:hypothetical protein PR003_g13153 [Phytophthora rubi]
MSMRDYVQKTRHLVSCIVTNPIEVVSQVHVFIFGMREDMTRYCLTRAEPSTLEAALALALREDYTVASSYARALTPDARPSAPEPMEIDEIEAESRSRSTSTARGPRFNNDNRPRDGRQLVCYRCRKSVHRAAVCRAPAPVLTSAEVVVEARDTFPTAFTKNGQDHPPVLYAHFNATTTNGDSRLILISLHVAGAERPHRTLLDSGATNNFIRDDCLALLPPHVRAREGPGVIVVKLADGKLHRAPRRAVSLAYVFDGFSTNDDFLVIELNYAFDCILGMPWLARYQPEIDWLARSVRRRVGYDVSEVFTHLLVAPSRHVAVVDRTSTTQPPQRESDGPRCVECAASVIGPVSNPPSRAREGLKKNTVEQWLPCENDAVEQRLPYVKNAVEQRLPHVQNAVEQRLPYVKNAVEQRLPHVQNAVEQGFPHVKNAVEQRFPHVKNAVEQRLSLENATVEQRLPLENATVEQRLPLENATVEQQDLRDTGIVETEFPCLEEGEVSSSESSSSETSRSTAVDPASSSEIPNVVEYSEGSPNQVRAIEVANPPSDAATITRLPGLSWKHFLRDLKAGEIEQVCLLTGSDQPDVLANAVSDDASSSRPKAAEPKSVREARFAAQSWSALQESNNPVYSLAREFEDIFPKKVSAELPAERGVRHEIDLVPGSKYCVTRQWPLPQDQVQAINEFFEGRRNAGHVRESVSPHSSPTFCVKKATGGWGIVHAFNKLNDATIPAQTPIPRKDMVLNTMSGSVIYSAIDLTDGFYPILMRESGIPLTAVSTPSGMLWEWLVMPQGLKNAPATFNRMVSHVLHPLRAFTPSYFDDIFVYSRAEDVLSAVDVHLWYLRKVFEKMRENKLYANLKKCVFCALENVSKSGVRADPEKISSICSWPTPKNQTELRHGWASRITSTSYAVLIQPMPSLLKQDVAWNWRPEHQDAFDTVKKSLASAPVLMLPDTSRPFHVVCDASDFAIGCALMQFDAEGRGRVVSYRSRQMKSAEKNYLSRTRSSSRCAML